MIRKTVFYSGRVQGVGFRYTTRRIASRRAVTGFVRNLSDGRVQLVAEGEPAELDRLVADIEQAMGDFIRNKQETESPATGEFDGFEVRH